MASDGPSSFTGGYDSSEMDAQIASWDAVRGNWNDVESERVESQTFVPMREACSLLGRATEDVKAQVALLEQELAEIESM